MHLGRDKVRDVPAELANLLDDARREVHVIRIRRYENGLDIRIEFLVCQRLLEFVVEIRDGAQTLDYRYSSLFLGICGKKSVVHIDNNIVEILDASCYEPNALYRAEI